MVGRVRGVLCATTGRLPRATALRYSCPGGVVARPGTLRVVNVPKPAMVALGVLVAAGASAPAGGVLCTAGDRRAVPAPGPMLATNMFKRSSLGSYESSTSSHEYGDLGSGGERSKGKARARMSGEAPTPAWDVISVVQPLVSPRTPPTPVSIESSP